jgi:Uma2 family endonuclease
LRNHIEQFQLGRLYVGTDTIFGEYDVCRPDILFFSTDRLHLIGPKAMEGPPDLAIEVLSPSSVEIDREDKFEQYRAGKVKHYWIVDPAKRVLDAYSLKKGMYVRTGRGTVNDVLRLPPFRDLEIQLAAIWHPPIPRKRNGRS